MSNPTKLEAASIGMFAGIIAGEIETVSYRYSCVHEY